MEEKERIKQEIIDVSLIETNDGQIDGVPANPRTISREKMQALKRSIQNLPDMLSMRELLVYPLNGKYIVIGGNMRYKACVSLGYKQVPCKIIPPPISSEKLRAIVMQDNNAYGETDWEMIASDWDLEELKDWSVDIPDEWNNLPEDTQEAEEDDFNEDDAQIAEQRCKLGDIWILGQHRLMCGDSTNAESIANLMNGDIADLYLTDPPYNVNYEGKTKDALKIQNDAMDDNGFRSFLVDSFIAADTVLRNGGAFYIWHADSEGFNFRYAVKSCNWMTKQCLIWNKNAMVIGRQDYQWKHEPCQPAGTMVRTPNGEVPIETLKDGNRVISYDKYSGVIKGFKEGIPVKTASRHYVGDLYGVKVGDKKTWATDNHRFTIRFHDAGRKIWCVYLMRRSNWWRVGVTETYNSRGFGLKQRMRQENADEAWILKIFSTRTEAQCYEQVVAVKYGIPYTHWEIDTKPVQEGYEVRTKEQIEWIYSHFDTEEQNKKATKLLQAFGRRIEHPLITKENRDHHLSTRSTSDVRACNLIPQIMELPIPYEKYNGTDTFEWQPITEVERKEYDGIVYSLQVEKYEHYIADGIVTHNCLYGWKPGSSHNWYSDRKQTTVIDFNKPNRNGEHPTMKPVGLFAYQIGNSTKKGDIVLDSFGGSGTTIIACEQLGRKARVMELDPHYCDVIISRWEKLTGEQAELTK